MIDKPEGIWCWGCGRRFVFKGAPTSGPLDAIRWREGLCDREDCPQYTIAEAARHGRETTR